MAGLTGNYTLTYSESSKGFPSFYSFAPDYMIGMNRFFYSFKGGNIWRHNTNDLRNTFYDVAYPATITSVFNDTPLENKVFKTINLESDDAWKATLTTDIQTTGLVEAAWFEKKEGNWFAFVRSDGPTGSATNESEWELRSLNGIGNSSAVGGVAATYNIDFPLTLTIGSILSVGDLLYYAVPPVVPVTTLTPVFAGKVTDIQVDLPNNTNRIVIDASPGTSPGATNPIPIQDAFFLYIKNPIAESHGILGHFCEFTLRLDSQTASELFAVESEVMKSFP